MVCSCPLPKGKVLFVGVALTSHLLSLASRTVTVGSRCLKARLYGWLPLSNAYGIIFVATSYHSIGISTMVNLTIYPNE